MVALAWGLTLSLPKVGRSGALWEGSARPVGGGLLVSGIDLRHAKRDNRWYCFEVNPSPAFSYYEQYTGQTIAAAVARLLFQTESP